MVDTLEVVLAVNGKEIDRIRIVRIRGEEGERCEYIMAHNAYEGVLVSIHTNVWCKEIVGVG